MERNTELEGPKNLLRTHLRLLLGVVGVHVVGPSVLAIFVISSRALRLFFRWFLWIGVCVVILSVDLLA